MPNDPIVIDDGGSTRVKLIERGGGPGKMDDLLDVDTLNATGKPYDGLQGAQFKVTAKGGGQPRYGSLQITYIDSLGKAFTSNSININQNFLIVSDDQKLMGELDSGAARTNVELTIFSDVDDPIVEAKERKLQRRYVVSNAPPIQSVDVDGTQVYDVTAPPFPPSSATVQPSLPIVYTTVVIT
jgi:hypothetical protein